MSQLPNDVKVRKLINQSIQQAVDSKIRQDGERSHQAAIAERVLDKTEMSKGEFNKRVAIRYKQQVDPKKYEEEKEWADVAYEENEILMSIK